MAEGHSNEFDFKCGICLSFYTEPRLLHCYHIFCTPCLDKLKGETNDITCPLCRNKTILCSDGINSLKVYPCSQVSGIEGKSETEICQLCFDENKASVKCLDCNINLCPNCSDYHIKLKASRTHKFEKLQISMLKYPDTNDEKGENKCESHGLDKSIICIPCNKFVCTHCRDDVHFRHKTETILLYAKLKRNNLLSQIAVLKSRVPVLEHAIEAAKSAEVNRMKNATRVKQEVQSQTTAMKEVFCRNIDDLTMKSLTYLDTIRKKDGKVIQTYIDELDIEKYSLICQIKSIETIINNCSDVQISEEFLELGKSLNTTLDKEVKAMPDIHNIQYKCGRFEENQIEKLFGKITEEVTSEQIEPTFPCLTLPKSFQHIHGFHINEKVMEMVPSENGHVCLRTISSVKCYDTNGECISSFNTRDTKSKLLYNRSKNENWFWVGSGAKRGSRDGEGFRVPFKDGIAGCFIHNGNLLVFNPNDKLLYEVTENDSIARKIEDTLLKSTLKEDNITMTETKHGNLVIAQGEQLIFTENNGKIKNTHQACCPILHSICTDNYGNIFAYEMDDLMYKEFLQFSENGISIENSLRRELSRLWICCMTIDECGNLSVSGDNKTGTVIQIYSYL